MEKEKVLDMILKETEDVPKPLEYLAFAGAMEWVLANQENK